MEMTTRATLVGVLSIVQFVVLDSGVHAGYADIVLSDSPLAYWRLGESDGNRAIEETGNTTLDGEYSDRVQLGVAGLICAEDDTAAEFSQAGSYLQIPHSPLINTGGPYSSRTIELWFRAEAVTTQAGVLFEEGGRERGLNIYVQERSGAKSLFMTAWNLSREPSEPQWGPVEIGVAIAERRTYHVALVFDDGGEADGRITGYLNGVEFDSEGGVDTLFNHLKDTGVGAIVTETRINRFEVPADGAAFQGVIDDVVIYDYPLDDPDGDEDRADGRVLEHFQSRAILEAEISMDTEFATVGEAVTFDGTSTEILVDEEVESYEWDFGDGETAAGANVEHAYTEAGLFRVALKVVSTSQRCFSAERVVAVSCHRTEISPWTTADIGEPLFPGSARFSDSQEGLEICTGGRGIGDADEFHFVYRESSDNGSLRLRIDAFESEFGAQVGVLLRAGTAPDAPHASVLMSVAPFNLTRLRFLSRTESGGVSDEVAGEIVEDLPVWVEIRREGDAVIGLGSKDGEVWTEIGRRTLSLPEPSLIGCGVAAGGLAANVDRFVPTVAQVTEIVEPGTRFIRGDSNSDSAVDLSDGVFVLNFLFLGGTRPDCMKSADTNDTNEIDLTDGIFLFSHLFLGGNTPPPPFVDCGEDPTPDELSCDAFPICAP